MIDKENMGSYRDDGLIIIKELNSHKLDKYREKTNVLKLLESKIAIKTNLKITLPRRNTKFRKRNIRTFQQKKRHTYLYSHLLKSPTLNHQTDTNIY